MNGLGNPFVTGAPPRGLQRVAFLLLAFIVTGAFSLRADDWETPTPP